MMSSGDILAKRMLAAFFGPEAGARRRHWQTVVLLLLLGGTAGCGLFVKTREAPVSLKTRAPDFSLSDQHGQGHTLAGFLDKGPVVIVFYRGHW